VRADVGDVEQATRLVHEAVKQLGRLDIVVNNAVTLDKDPLGAIDLGRVRACFATNVEGVIATVQAAMPHLQRDSGRVINISTLAATHALPGMSVYTATKGAIDAMTRTWARELGPKGITVNAVAPGAVDTDAMKEIVDDAMRAFFLQRTPLGRIGKPDDIADAVAFLASPDARWVTGQVLAVTGGFTP
jgi:3-oxoacyl-[acyl-carrier protein] reductase